MAGCYIIAFASKASRIAENVYSIRGIEIEKGQNAPISCCILPTQVHNFAGFLTLSVKAIPVTERAIVEFRSREEDMTWWTWMILGALLLGAELLAIDAQFFLVFLGVSAALVGLAGLLGVTMPEWMQWLAFAILSLIFMFTFRKQLYEKVRSGGIGFDSTPEGETLTIEADIEPGATARIQHRGSDWTAVNVGESPITSGSRAKIVEVDGLTLHVSAD